MRLRFVYVALIVVATDPEAAVILTVISNGTASPRGRTRPAPHSGVNVHVLETRWPGRSPLMWTATVTRPLIATVPASVGPVGCATATGATAAGSAARGTSRRHMRKRRSM